MKKIMKNQGSAELPRFVVGALAAAGASVSNGAAVQIFFANNVVTSTAGLTNFTADLTGDGLTDLFAGYNLWTASVGEGGFFGKAHGDAGMATARFGYAGSSFSLGRIREGVAVARGLVRFGFSDGQINLGSETRGWLDLEARGDRIFRTASIKIHRLIFDDASTTAPTGLTSSSTGIPEWQVSPVPEPGSNLALLALGASGLTMRRRLKSAA